MSNYNSLAGLGWRAFFQQQLTMEEWDEAVPARVVEQHRSELVVATASSALNLPLQHTMPDLVVGDWILLDSNAMFVRSLERKSCFARKAPGSQLKKQLISANVDTAFILCSMNDDFNLSRIERYLSLVNESGADPVVLLSKSDQCDEPEELVEQVQRLDSLLPVLPINCTDPAVVTELHPWISEGSTIVVMGSSGVGKSTLVNTLLGEKRQDTGGIREYALNSASVSQRRASDKALGKYYKRTQNEWKKLKGS